MRRQPVFWVLLSVVCFLGAAYLWHRAKSPATLTVSPKATAPEPAHAARATQPDTAAVHHQTPALTALPENLPAAQRTNALQRPSLAHRLSNTTLTVGELVHRERAILLENALLDTTQPTKLAIPSGLRSQGEPGAYIVQAKRPLDDPFRSMLRSMGATVIAYVPNNAYLVRASATVADGLGWQPLVQTVLPYEPYYKLKGPLLDAALAEGGDGNAGKNGRELNLLLFADAHDTARAEVEQLGGEVLGETKSPFGPVLQVRAPAGTLSALAGLSGVQELETLNYRIPANDLSRSIVGTSLDSQVPTNYLNLDGHGITVNVNDTGVDATHPDLTGRVFFDVPSSGLDTNGHGTHVAATIAGNGSQSMTLTNVPGSVMPPTNGQFRGMAPLANIFSLAADPLFGPSYSDVYLQERTALGTNSTGAQVGTNIFISNNSWNYAFSSTYDLAAASYDAAVRDALPLTTGPQPLLFVFAAGDSGSGNANGAGGLEDTILSPATAKNVITVGATELPRGLTNQVAFDIPDGLTNDIWLTESDNLFDVADYSSRGNVGVGVEGDNGRFKPDLVAPGSFVASARSTQWDQTAYYSWHQHLLAHHLFLNPGQRFEGVFDPRNVAGDPKSVNIYLVDRRSPGPFDPVGAVPFPPLPIFLSYNHVGLPARDALGTNQLIVNIPPATTTTNWLVTVVNVYTQMVALDMVVDIAYDDPTTDEKTVWRGINDSLGGTSYRLESGTSMSAADVSGNLALIQQFLENHGRVNGVGGPQGRSPALLKAMLINGARTLAGGYGFQPSSTINYQGWGLIQLPSTLHGGLADETQAGNSMWLLDQDPTNALPTGRSETFNIKLSPEGQNLPLRVTLVWSDPPANPAVGTKLVNDLDLIVTNLDSVGPDVLVYYGNNFSGGAFSTPIDPTLPPNFDSINNVENVFVDRPLGSNYSITVTARRVNVNAVALNPNQVAQDFALVISCGDGFLTNAVSFANGSFSPASVTSSNVMVVHSFTNNVQPGGCLTGQVDNQRVGANSPLIGTNTVLFSDYRTSPNYDGAQMTIGVTNQWNFYIITNPPSGAGFTITFGVSNALDLSTPRMGVDAILPDTNPTRKEADVDLYFSPDPTLLQLSPSALSNAFKAIGRGASETVVATNMPDGVYYAAVKSEDQMAAGDFSVFFSICPAQASTCPLLLRGLPIGIPDAAPRPPAYLNAGIATVPLVPADTNNITCVSVRRVIVTNVISHELLGDLTGILTCSGGRPQPDGSIQNVTTNIVLFSHSPDGAVAGRVYIYDDSDQGDIPGSIHSSGPGSLNDFEGIQCPKFTFTILDNALNHTGTNNLTWIRVETNIFSQCTASLCPDCIRCFDLDPILPGRCRDDVIQAPPGSSCMVISETNLSGGGPFTFEICQLNPAGECTGTNLVDITPGSGATVQLDLIGSFPRYFPGAAYVIRTCNLDPNNPISIRLCFSFCFGPIEYPHTSYNTNPVAPIKDDASTYFAINITNHGIISSIDSELLITNPFPRVSDLAITLISPNGQRILLFEDRGRAQATTVGTDSGSLLFTNIIPIYTNDFEDVLTGPYAPGSIFGRWNVLTNWVTVFPELPAPWLSNNVLLAGSGVISNYLPVTNSSPYPLPLSSSSVFALSFEATHAPYLVGTVGWWPLDQASTDKDSARTEDIFGQHDGYVLGGGDTQFLLTNAYRMFGTGIVQQALWYDGSSVRVIVPRSADTDVAPRGGFSFEGWINPTNIAQPAPIFQWFDPLTTNGTPPGVQLWLSGLPGSSSPGSLWLNMWDTNSQAHILTTVTNALTNGGWQHVAFTYDPPSRIARLYTNGFLASFQQMAPTNEFRPRTAGDLYFGFDPTPQPAPYSFPSFLNANGLNLVGSAALVGGRLRLTPSVAGQIGAAWGTNKQPVAAGFDTRFQFQISNPSSPAADGFSFTVQNLGPAANNIFANLGTGAAHVSVWFNTYQNWPGCFDYVNCDRSDNSIGIVTNAVYVAQTDLTPLGINLHDGAVHAAHITFDGNAMSVWVDNTLVLNAIPMPGLKPATDALGEAWVGLAGFTGASWETHDILSWTFDGPSPWTAFKGGQDEFGLYNRQLTDCEVLAIATATNNGKYGTNVLWCPLTNSIGAASGTLQFLTALPSPTYTYTFTNGLDFTSGAASWTNGPQWQTNLVFFTNLVLSATTNGPPTNFTSLLVSNCDPNLALDDFVLYVLATNSYDGLMRFTEDTNLAHLPIKFASVPYVMSNFPAFNIFTNNFESSLVGEYPANSPILGKTNLPPVPVLWTNLYGPVTVLSNSLLNANGTNCLALSTNGVFCILPTTNGHRYRLTYDVRGPGAVSWWSGDIEPYSQRAWDLLGGNHGFFFFDATNNFTNIDNTFVGPHILQLPGYPDPTNNLVSRIEVGDPPNLRLTNSFTIEGWFRPLARTNSIVELEEMVLCRGDSRTCNDPYWFSLERVANDQLAIAFHVESADNATCGVIFESAASTPKNTVFADEWQHIAAVFDYHINWTNTDGTINPWPTNEMRLYLRGVPLTLADNDVFMESPAWQSIVNTTFTGENPFRDLDPAYGPAVTIGSRRHPEPIPSGLAGPDNYQPFRGDIDELTVYGRALTASEIAAIATRGRRGKANTTVAPGQSLAELSVLIDGTERDHVHPDNSDWTSRTIEFVALGDNSVLTLQSLQPGTIVDQVVLAELPSELNYLPETPLSVLNGQDTFGTWQLEITDTRSGPSVNTNDLAKLLTWVLNFRLSPISPPPIVELEPCMSYTNTITGNSAQYFVVNVPQWATMATNILEFAYQYFTTNQANVGVMYDTNGFPLFPTNGIIWPPAFQGTNVLMTNSSPWLNIGMQYYLAVTNTNSYAVTFALNTCFDITVLTNCAPLSNYVWQAGIPRYFQFEVPTNAIPQPFTLQTVAFSLTGVSNYPVGFRSNVTVVLSEHLPLPDLAHFDYMSFSSRTNDDVIMVVSNSTPWGIQSNKWYVGVFSSAPTNVPFVVEACYDTNYPVLIPLTNGLPFAVTFASHTNFLALAGPPQGFFYEFNITNDVDGILFELYNLTGNGDLVLQRDVVPGSAPYFAGSYHTGTTPEQIVLRPTGEFSTLVGRWFLGVINNETNKIAYTIRATIQAGGLLQSAQPFRVTLTTLAPPLGLGVQWNSLIGEHYIVQFTPTIRPAPAWLDYSPLITATTPLTMFSVPLPLPNNGSGFYRVVHVSSFFVPRPPLTVQLWTNNLVRISWPITFPGETLQSSTTGGPPWFNVNFPVTIEGAEFVVYDTLGPLPRFYRLVP